MKNPFKKQPERRAAQTWDGSSAVVRKKAKKYAVRFVPEQAPSWKELAQKGSMVEQETPILEPIARYQTLKFAAALLSLVVIGTFYVRHINTTEKVYKEYRILSQQNTVLRLEKDRLTAEYNRISSPQAVLKKATALGLREGYKFEQTITVD
jgi:hypothetical protein